MAITDTRGVRHVRCPKCHSVLQEPSVPVYQCGGCGTSLRAKISAGKTQEVVGSAPSSEGGLPPQSRHLGSSDVTSTSASTPDAPTTRDQATGTTSRCETGDLMSAREHHASEQVLPIVQKKGHDRSTSQEADGSSEPHRGRDAFSAERSADAPNVSVNFSRESSKYAAELQDSEKRREAKSEPEAATKKDSGEAARPRSRDLEEAAATPVRSPDSQPAGDDVFKMSPLHEKILKTVDELKGDLSALFSKSQEVKPRTPARSPRLPKQEGHVSRPAIPSSRARHAAAAAAAAAVHHRGNAGYVGSKHGQVAPRGLPSRRYRRCRADPCGHDVRPSGTCRHSCCSHGKPECSSCRGHCCGSRAQEPAPRQKPAAAREAKRRPPPRQHCRPVLKGAPFIVCSSCFTLVQLPAGFAVASNKVSKLRCGSCSTVLSYSYRDPDRKKPAPQSVDQCSTDGSEARHGEGGRAPTDLFAFIDDFAAAHGANYSYSTEDEQPLHVSRNSSFDTVVEPNGAAQSTSLHRLMGYGSASELLLRRSPSLYESSFDRRSTSPPDASMRYDRKGKGVCVDDADDVAGDDDSDEEYGGAPKRSSVRGFGWTHGKGVHAPGAIRIRS